MAGNEIEFWEDLYMELPWVQVSELVVEPVKLHWYSKKTKMHEVEHHIDSGWTFDNRLDLAKEKIRKYIEREMTRSEEKRQIDEFCHLGK